MGIINIVRNYGLKFSLLSIGFLMAFPVTSVDGQVKETGLPFIENFTTNKTSAGKQTWDIIEDNNGNIYFGNTYGIVCFDSEDWEIISIENGSAVRSLALGVDGKVYVGGYTEIGVLEEDERGKRTYKSLNHLIPKEYRSFDDVWKVYQTRYGIIFQSFEYIFILNGDSINVIEPESRFGFSYYINNNFFIIEKGIGLRVLSNDKLNTVSDSELFTSSEIRLILPHHSNALLIGSFSEGLFILDGDKLSKWDVKLNNGKEKINIYNGSEITNGYAFGTVNNGVYLSDKDGNLIQHINRTKGLQNNTVLSHYYDSRNNLWLGLDNGIDYLKVSLPLSLINYNYNIQSVYTSIVYNGRLYIGTNQGLFSKRMDQLSEIEDIGFEMIENTEGQVWALRVIDGELLCGNNWGAYRISGTSAIKISESRGVWNFFSLFGIDDHLFSGTYDGIIVYEKDNSGHWLQTKKVEGFDILSARKIICDNDNNIWISHDYKGLFKVRLSDDFSHVSSVKEYKDSTSGIKGKLPNNIHFLNNQFFVSTTEGNYNYDKNTDRFTEAEELNNLFKGIGKINFLNTDFHGNHWYAASEKIGFLKLLEDGTYSNIFTPLQQIVEFLQPNYEHVYIHDIENIFIASEIGLFHYSQTSDKEYFTTSFSHIKRIDISSKTEDSILSYKGNRELDEDDAYEKFRMGYEWDMIKFTYNCPDPENFGNIEYSYRLLGSNDEWSDWSNENQKEYSNLRDGNYTFEVKAKNIYNNISEFDSFTFSVAPPFYRSFKAYALYLFLFGLILLISIYLLRKRIRFIRESEEEKREKEKQVADQQLEQLKVEKLEADMRHMNKELANSTYHIIQKNKLLNSLKQELQNISKVSKNEFVEDELKKICKKIDRDINNRKNWEVFDWYFDEIHQEFLDRIKKKHPELSPKELRLSAYLRMNISTKEIAPLMNISVRGVEISRYRLRKKLELNREMNLTQYLMEI